MYSVRRNLRAPGGPGMPANATNPIATATDQL